MHIRNLMLTMLLCGLWHGVNWTFIIWGGYHGLLHVTLEDRFHFAVVVNPHYDTGYKYKTNFKLSAGMDLHPHIGIKAEYQKWLFTV